MCYASDESDDVCDKVSSAKRFPEVNKLEVLYNTALILKQKVAEISKLDFPWPPLASYLTIDNVKKVVPHQLVNTLAWICGLSSEPVFNEYVKISSKENAKLMSIAQDVVN